MWYINLVFNTGIVMYHWAKTKAKDFHYCPIKSVQWKTTQLFRDVNFEQPLMSKSRHVNLMYLPTSTLSFSTRKNAVCTARILNPTSLLCYFSTDASKYLLMSWTFSYLFNKTDQAKGTFMLSAASCSPDNSALMLTLPVGYKSVG